MSMINETLLSVPDGWVEVDSICRDISGDNCPVCVYGPTEAQKAHFAGAIAHKSQKKLLFVAANEFAALKLYKDFFSLFGEGAVYCASRDIVVHDVEARNYDQVFARLEALDRIYCGDYAVAITSIEAAALLLPPPTEYGAMILEVKTGDVLDMGYAARRLFDMGYENAGMVEAKGAFAVRGGILDVFPVNSEAPVRIELFDDEIDTIRYFDYLTQRSIEPIDRIRIIPARDVFYNDGNYPSIRTRIMKDVEGDGESPRTVNQGLDANRRDYVAADLEKFESVRYFPGIDRYIAYLYDEDACLLDYASYADDDNVGAAVADVIVVFDEPARSIKRLDDIIYEHATICRGLIEKGKMLKTSYRIRLDSYQVLKVLKRFKLICASAMQTVKDVEIFNCNKSYAITGQTYQSYRGNVEQLKEDVKGRIKNRWVVILLVANLARGESIAHMLSKDDIATKWLDAPGQKPVTGALNLLIGELSAGLEYPREKLLVLCDTEFQYREKSKRKPPRAKNGARIEYFTDLNEGDYVVHRSHGVAVFAGLEQLEVDGVTRDYLKLKYRKGDYLYVPTNQLDFVQKYIGNEERPPKINSLGGADWSRAKFRVKESLKKLAAELILIYAKRREKKGFQYSGDTVWQRQFEEQFPYEETEDQLRSTEEIKKDMESPSLMDRLLCGDVGFGKTEVALRAVFKAVNDGKQTAFLVPTTVLAQQHYNTFVDRFKDFPITIDVISRFRTASEQKKIIEKLRLGRIDVLIGTHRMLNKDICFKDLGLLVVDEEQRFGVAHKEKLKKMKPDVDVLSLSATPIPRTLHMSMTKIRDISVLKVPPEERFPVQTFVMEYDEDIVQDAILREIARGGQVFYLYNRVHGIDAKTLHLKELLRGVEIEYAHGQMADRELEDVMIAFVGQKFNVLVCTTIIESGLDMPNVNTIIVEDADKMGLAQLYQIRGRVGRSNKMAYAYITYRRDKIITEEAEKRLKAIREFTELGAGFKIAIRDMEIRGIGNILGMEQHGHMGSVGYDMYCRLLDEAVSELEDDVHETKIETSIEMNVNAYIDRKYINDEAERLEMYQKIAGIGNDDDAADVLDELIDRYGAPPDEINNLILTARIKALATFCGFSSVTEKPGIVLLNFSESASINMDRIAEIISKYKSQLLFSAGTNPHFVLKPRAFSPNDSLNFVLSFLKDYSN